LMQSAAIGRKEPKVSNAATCLNVGFHVQLAAARLYSRTPPRNVAVFVQFSE